jgi:hypothetical protein
VKRPVRNLFPGVQSKTLSQIAMSDEDQKPAVKGENDADGDGKSEHINLKVKGQVIGSHVPEACRKRGNPLASP